MNDAETMKIEGLTPESRNVNLVVKVISVGEPKDIETKYGSKHLAEATIADDTAALIMTLWEEQVEEVSEGEVLEIENAYISLVRGSMRLNLGRYGKMKKLDEDIETTTTPNKSDELHDMPPRRGGFRGGDRGGDRGGSRGGYGGKSDYNKKGKGYGKWV
ncbi:MAG: single stranded DNA-binding domain-containing protein [Methermicoccaceae archaeon]